MKASACVATAEKKAEESGEEREKQLGTRERWFSTDVNLIKKLFRLQEECRYAAIHNWRTPTDCLAPSSRNCSRAWMKKKDIVVPSKEWHK